MNDLIKRLEEATEGSEQLDLDIAIALGLKKPVYSLDDSYAEYASKSPPFTTSLDAALTLVPEGSEVELHFGGGAELAFADVNLSVPGVADGCGRSPALALCIAALKARL